MQEWLQSVGLSLDEAEVLLAALAILGGMLAGLRQLGFHRITRSVTFWSHLADRSYSAWFARTWGRYDNPYLREIEDLDLRNTYVSLAFRGEEADERIDAGAVLGDRSFGNIVIEGDPGSGKSTLLRAYGVGASRLTAPGQVSGPPGRRGLSGPLGRSGAAARTRPAGHGPASGGRARTRPQAGRATPMLVPLRRFARTLTIPGRTLAGYLVSDILVSGWGRSPKDAEAFLRRSLATDRLVVLLDGLDEVPADRQEAVLEAVYRFTQDRNPQLPTARARVIVTCRRQNFVALRERWINVIKDGVYTLAPLRDSEIYAYLQKLSTRFRDPEHGPEAFLHAVRASGSLDLHRTPLVLAMSVGLYAQKTTFEIPSEIAELYGQMITEMLERQAFKKDPGTSLLRYTVADKVRLLREFAAGNAQGREGFGERFGEFSLAMLSRHAKDLASRLDAVDDPVAFVREIVDRSGLIAPVGDGMCVFAHRSIQEYLVAEELRQFAPNGAQILLDHAADPAWRQVVLFYTGTDRQSQSAVDDFLLRLAEDDLPLAGHCLAGAKATNPVARTILHRIADEVRAQHAVCLHLSAMLGATRSPRMAVRELAVFLVRDVLSEIIGQPDVFEVLGGDLDGVARVIQALAETDAAHVAELVPKIVSAVPDDPSLVAPLWLCLAVPGLADQPGAARIVERLLTLVMAPEGLAELETQQPISSAFATAELRRAVYPFRKGHPLHSNLVTLLCWAQHLRAIPMPPNRFFEASLADRSAFARVEEDRNRTQLAMLHWPARIVSATGAAAALLAAVAVCLRWNDLARPPGWLTLWWMLLPLVAVPVAFFTATAWAERRPEQSLASQYLRGGSAPGSGRSGNLVAEALARVVPGSGAQLLFLVTTVVYAVATLPLNAVSPAGYALTAAAANAVFGWLPFIRVFDRGVRYYLYRPNPFSDMYDDGRSRPWLDPDASHSSSRPVLAENRPE